MHLIRRALRLAGPALGLPLVAAACAYDSTTEAGWIRLVRTHR